MVLEAGGVPIFPDRDSATWFHSAELSIIGVVEFETYKVYLPCYNGDKKFGPGIGLDQKTAVKSQEERQAAAAMKIAVNTIRNRRRWGICDNGVAGVFAEKSITFIHFIHY